MSELPSMTWVTGLVSVISAIAVSPLLAGWTAAFGVGAHVDIEVPWWHARSVSARRLVVVAAVAAALTACAAGGTPLPAWWLFAAGGAVLCIVDAEHHLLPARLVYPLGAVVLAALALSAALAGEPDRLLRAVLAAAVVGGGWFTVAFLAPPAVGLGDVRVAALAAGLLGWTGWSAVLAGQLAAFGLAAVTVAIIGTTSPAAGRPTQVPMGPALVVGALVAAWL
jgi:leader peptidase (prepilin peptidase)/N-methyltransferase